MPLPDLRVMYRKARERHSSEIVFFRCKTAKDIFEVVSGTVHRTAHKEDLSEM